MIVRHIESIQICLDDLKLPLYQLSFDRLTSLLNRLLVKMPLEQLILP
jgi:hypothetical protein